MIFVSLQPHTQITKAMEYVLFLPFAIFLIIIIFLIKSAFLPDKKTNDKVDNKAEEKEEWRKKQEEENASKFPKIEYSLQDTCIYCDVVGISYRNSYAIERARKLQNFEPLVLIWEDDNPKDCCAVMVYTTDGHNIGYIPAKIASDIYDKLDELLYCVVNGNSYGYNAPYISIAIILKGKHKQWYKAVISTDIYHENALAKYPELKELEDNKFLDLNGYCDGLKTLLLDNPDDFYLEFNFLEALIRCGKWDEAEEYSDNLIAKYPLIEGMEELEELMMTVTLQRLNEAKLKRQKELEEQHCKAKDLYNDKKYEEALELLLDCIDNDYYVQITPRLICRCYEKLGRDKDLQKFLKKILKKKWLTEHNKDLLEKFLKEK